MPGLGPCDLQPQAVGWHLILPSCQDPDPCSLQMLAPWTHGPLPGSGCWPHTQRPFSQEELEVEFANTRHTTLVRSMVRQMNVSPIYTSNAFYPLISLFPCNKSWSNPKFSSSASHTECDTLGCIFPQSKRIGPALIYLDSTSGTALGGPEQAVPPFEFLIWASVYLWDSALPWPHGDGHLMDDDFCDRCGNCWEGVTWDVPPAVTSLSSFVGLQRSF